MRVDCNVRVNIQSKRADLFNRVVFAGREMEPYQKARCTPN